MTSKEMISKNLLVTKKEQVKRMIEKIHYEHREYIGGRAYSGTESPETTEEFYNYILELLPEIPGLTREDIEELRTELETRIAEIPEVEKAKETEAKENIEKKNKAFDEAKDRYKNLSLFRKVGCKIRQTTPKSLDINRMAIDAIDELYR